ncbi:hypothetical protein UlMin_001121 [Ulmus minor]
MKLSLKLQDDQHQPNPLIKAKIPITIFNQPFLSSLSTTPTTTISNSPSSHLSFSISSNFPSGPSLKFCYTPTSPSSNPFSLSLKSGLGLFGSPNQSPLVFTTHFTFSSTNPTFFLHLKPQFGNFSLKKSTSSNPNSNRISGSFSNGGINLDSGLRSDDHSGDGFVREGSSVCQELKLEPCGDNSSFSSSDCKDNFRVYSNGGMGSAEDKFFSGIAVMARTVLPVTKSLAVNMRWGVNFPANLGSKFPYLTLNKIGVERIEEMKEEKKEIAEGKMGDLELLKGMCFWMKRDLELLEKENGEMKNSLEQMKLRAVSGKRLHGESDGVGKTMQLPPTESSGDYERWKSRKNGREENGRREPQKSTNASDLESELQRAIKAAST